MRLLELPNSSEFGWSRPSFIYRLRQAVIDRKVSRSHTWRGSVLKPRSQAIRKSNACNSCRAFTKPNLRSADEVLAHGIYRSFVSYQLAEHPSPGLSGLARSP